MERFFERFAELPEDEMGLEAFRRLASEADTDVVGPPLADSHPLPQRAGASNDLDVTIAAVRQGVSAFIQGDPMPQRSLWSKRDDVTLANPFGPPRRGWSDVEETIERAAAEFSDGTVSFEEVSKVVTADLAYLVQIERFSAKVGGRDEPSSGSLRVTMILPARKRRLEDRAPPRRHDHHASPGGIRHPRPVRRRTPRVSSCSRSLTTWRTRIVPR